MLTWCKIWPSSNQLAVEELSSFDTVTIVGGCNNCEPSVKADYDDSSLSHPWVSQTEEEMHSLEKTINLVLDEGKEVIVPAAIFTT